MHFPPGKKMPCEIGVLFLTKVTNQQYKYMHSTNWTCWFMSLTLLKLKVNVPKMDYIRMYKSFVSMFTNFVIFKNYIYHTYSHPSILRLSKIALLFCSLTINFQQKPFHSGSTTFKMKTTSYCKTVPSLVSVGIRLASYVQLVD